MIAIMLPSLILTVVPLQTLESTTSLKIVRKVHEALRHIMAGLIFNSDMNAESLLLLSHGLISENLPLLTEKAKWVPGCCSYGLLLVGRFACRNGSSQIRLVKCVRVSLLSFPFCFQCNWIIWAIRGQGESLVMGVSVCWTHGSLLLQALGTFSKAFSLSHELITYIWMLGWRDKGQCLEAGCKHSMGPGTRKDMGFHFIALLLV